MSQSFISQLYQSILGRQPDASGLAFWQEMIEYGGISSARMTEQFISSAEYKAFVQPVTQLYFVAFDRAPEADGVAFWIQTFRQGAMLEAIASGFERSDEFQSRYGQTDDEAFVIALYRNSLRREPEDAGKAYWLEQLSVGLPRASILSGFSSSDEMTELRAQEVDFALLYLALTGVAPTMAMIQQVVPVRSWTELIESIYTGPNYVGTDVPGLARFFDPEPQTPAEQPVERPLELPPESDQGPAPDNIAPTIRYSMASATTLSVQSSEAGTAGLYAGSSDSNLIGTATTLSRANTPYVLPVRPQSAVTTSSLQVSDIAGNVTTGSARVFLGTDQADNIVGTPGDDYIFGFDGNDTITGGAGADVINAGAGTNVINDAGVGADVIMHDSVGTVAINVTGTDTVTLSASQAGATATGANSASRTINASTSTAGVSLIGGDGNDVLTGGAGNDTITGGAGADTLRGGDGFDTISYADVTSPTSHGLANIAGMAINLSTNAINQHSIDIATRFKLVIGGGDKVEGATLAARSAGYLVASAINSSTLMVRDTLVSFEAVIGSALSDYIQLGDGGMSADGGDGNDVITDGGGNDTINGGAGNDVIRSFNGGSNVINAGSGNDTILSGYGTDTIEHDNRDSTVLVEIFSTGLIFLNATEAGASLRRIDAFNGSLDSNVDASMSTAGITFVGNAGNDNIIGGTGNDTITGGAGADTLTGGLGADTFVFERIIDSTVVTWVNAESDLITDFLSGTDKIVATLDYNLSNTDLIFDARVLSPQSGTGPVSENLTGAIGQAVYDTSNRGLWINGNADKHVATSSDYWIRMDSSRGDTVLDGDINFIIRSGSGNDLISGGAGSDTIEGGDGDDTITGGAGADVLTGGLGADTFVYSSGSTGLTFDTADTITDFVTGVDRISTGIAGSLEVAIFFGLATQASFDYFITLANNEFAKNINILVAIDDFGIGGDAWVAIDNNGDGKFNDGDSFIVLTGINNISKITFTDFIA